eukprot:4689630-Pleurochrysis_carterae.AAC.1
MSVRTHTGTDIEVGVEARLGTAASRSRGADCQRSDGGPALRNAVPPLRNGQQRALSGMAPSQLDRELCFDSST